MSAYPHVFSPFRIGKVEVKNRIEFAPALSFLNPPDGYVNKEMIAFVQSLARGGAGIITIGESPVDFEYAKDHEFQLNLGDDSVIAGLSLLAEAVHRYGAKISIELSHGGRMILNRRQNPIGPSPIPCKREELMAQMEGRRVNPVVEMDQDMIDRVIENYAAAAERCLKAGFEMIMIHGAHGNLLAQFLSPYSNKRRDRYGGSLENRARFPIEVLSAIRKRVGDRLAIEYRISASEMVPGGMEPEETIEFVKMIEDKIDLLHVSAGLLSDPDLVHHIIQSTYLPHGYNVHYAEKLKKALRVPITTVGSISDLEMAEEIIASGKADMVAMVRAILADPEIVNKSRRGEPEESRPCLRCHYCNRLNLPIRCAVNPVLGRETEYAVLKPAAKRKKVVVVGGGPAGMEAAIVASARGHEVVLFEKSNQLGGNVIVASGPPFKGDMRRFLAWLVHQTEKAANVTVKLNTAATPEMVQAEKADVVIVAVGSEPLVPTIPGVDGANVVEAGQVHLGKAAVGERVVVAGGGLTGCEAALHLAQEGKKVTVVEMVDERELLSDVHDIMKFALLDLFQKHGVRVITEVKIEEITAGGVVVMDKEWKRYTIPADTVVLALGFKARADLARSFAETAPDVYIIGDAVKPQNVKAAIHDGFNVAVEI